MNLTLSSPFTLCPKLEEEFQEWLQHQDQEQLMNQYIQLLSSQQPTQPTPPPTQQGQPPAPTHLCPLTGDEYSELVLDQQQQPAYKAYRWTQGVIMLYPSDFDCETKNSETTLGQPIKSMGISGDSEPNREEGQLLTSAQQYDPLDITIQDSFYSQEKEAGYFDFLTRSLWAPAKPVTPPEQPKAAEESTTLEQTEVQSTQNLNPLCVSTVDGDWTLMDDENGNELSEVDE